MPPEIKIAPRIKIQPPIFVRESNTVALVTVLAERMGVEYLSALAMLQAQGKAR